MLELLKIRKDINWLIDQVKCLLRKKDLAPFLSATEWSINHDVSTGNPYIKDSFVWLDGDIYKSLVDNNVYLPTNTAYWEKLGEGHLLLEEQSDWDATTGRPFIRNKPTKTSDFINDGEDGTHPFITSEDAPVPTLQSVTDEGNITNNPIIVQNTENLITVNLGADAKGLYIELDNGSTGIDILDNDAVGITPFTYRSYNPDTDIYTTLTSINELGEITAQKFIKSGGLSTEFLMADGSISNAVPTPLSALPFKTDHLSATNNEYVVGDVVWYLGNVYRCIANNDSLLPTATSYWTLIGAGYPLVQQPADWDSSSGNNQILNKPTIPAPLGYIPVNVAGDTMLGTLVLNADPINSLDAATKQYVDRIEEHTYAEYITLINDDALLPERYYALIDYQHKYYIEESNTSLKKVYGAVSDINTSYWVIDSDVHDDLNIGMTVTITSLPLGYTGVLTVGETTTVTTADYNYYYRFANGMSYQYDAVGVGLSWSYTRYAINTGLNNATVYDTHGKVIMQPNGIVNTTVHDGTAYGNLTAAENFTPPIEKIVLRAKSTNSFYEDCYSLTYLNDELIYDFNDNVIYNDNDDSIGTRNGFIKRRFNKVLNIDIPKDWRVQRYRRWLIPPATLTSDYRKKLLNQNYPTTNTYLSFQNKYLFTSELMSVSSTDNMYICTTPEYSTLTAGITASTVSYPITIDGFTGGVGSTEDIVNFKDYTIFELDLSLNPLEVDRCEIQQFNNTVFINTDATNRSPLFVSLYLNGKLVESTFFGYPYLTGISSTYQKINAFDKVLLTGYSTKVIDVNILGYGNLDLIETTIENTIFGSLPYYVWFSGMGPVTPESSSGTPVRWFQLYSNTSRFKNCLIGVGYGGYSASNTVLSGGSLFNYGSMEIILSISSCHIIQNTELINTSYHNYYVQKPSLIDASFTSKLIKISQAIITGTVPEVILQSDVNSALYYQNLDIVTPLNTISKKYNYTTFLFETTPTSGTTDLEYIPSPTNGIVTSNTGTDATLLLADGTNAGLLTPAEKTKIANSVPYTGAVSDVNLGLNDITAASFIKEGGFDFQFLKANGDVDNNTYLTSADLPSTLDLYATTSPDPIIAGYTALVRNITDLRYDTIAVDVPTPTITGTIASPTFCGAVISDPSILLGNPGVFNFSVIGKIRRTGGSTSSGADFFYGIYKRDILGVETLIANSSPVVVPANGGTYIEYISIALWNDGTFLSTDRIVLKFYGIQTGGGSGAAYEFQFGGTDPVRGTAAISSAIIPNLYLRDLADVEKTDALNNEVLYWNDPASLWEHSLVENLVPNANATQKGLVSTGVQTFAGAKTFTGAISASNLSGTNTGDNATNTTSNSYADAKVVQTITDGVTVTAPSQNAVFDALSLKANDNAVVHLAGSETMTGIKTIAPVTQDEEDFPARTILTVTNADTRTGDDTILGKGIVAFSDGIAIDASSVFGKAINAFSEVGIAINAVSYESTAIQASSDGIAIKAISDIGTSIFSDIGTSAKGVVINSLTESTGNVIEHNKNGVTNFSVNQAGVISGSNLSGTNTGDQDLSGYAPIVSNNILINSVFPIDTDLVGTAGGVSYSQNGRNVMINNAATAITVTVTNTFNNFIASYTKLSASGVSIVFNAPGLTLVSPLGLTLSGTSGSTALVTKNGSTVYILLNNL